MPPPPQCVEILPLPLTIEAAIFQLSFLNLVGLFMVIRAWLGIFLGSFRKTMWLPQPILWKNAIYRQLVLLSCKVNLSIIDMLDRCIYFICVNTWLWVSSFKGVQGLSNCSMGALVLWVVFPHLLLVLEFWNVKSPYRKSCPWNLWILPTPSRSNWGEPVPKTCLSS